MRDSRILKTIAGGQDRPLVINDIKIDCYVLEDEVRVLSQRGLFRSVALPRTSMRHAPVSHGNENYKIVRPKWLSPYISNKLAMDIQSPVLFQRSEGGRPTYGYPAQCLVELCNAIIEADKNGATSERQASTVEHAMRLLQGLATVGIIALVDEATGYQDTREKRALATILERFLEEELRPWTKTFPMIFYLEIGRLKGWKGFDGINRPSVIGAYTNDLVYKRIAPGLLNELKLRNPVIPETGRRRHRFHQWFSPEYGHPKLKEHLAGIIRIMKASHDWNQFMRWVNKFYPKYEYPLSLPFSEDV